MENIKRYDQVLLEQNAQNKLDEQHILRDAIREGRYSYIKTLLSEGVDPNAYIGGRTALEWCVYHDQPEAIKILIDFGANPCVGDDNSLYFACIVANEEIVKILLDAGCSPNGNANGLRTRPILVSCSRSEPDIIYLLIEAGADPNTTTPETMGGSKKSCLYVAAEYGNTEVVKVLLDAGVDPNSGDLRLNDKFTSALEGAVNAEGGITEYGEDDHIGVAKELIKAGADWKLAFRDLKEMSNFFKKDFSWWKDAPDELKRVGKVNRMFGK